MELVTEDLVQPRRHLRRHMVRPVPGDTLPEECVARHGAVLPRGATTRPIHLQSLHLVEAAQLHDGRDVAGGLLGGRERAAHELGEPPHVAGGVPQQVLVLQEERPVRGRDARAPVREDVVPDRAGRHGAVADGLERVGEREVRLGASEEVPERDHHVLGVPAHVRDPAPAGGSDDGRREQGVGQVRVHQSRRRERVELRVLPAGEDLVDERDAVVRVHPAERVPGVRGRVRRTRRRGEGQRLEPCRAALGVAGEDHVVGARREAALEHDGSGHPVLRQPEALVQTQLQDGLLPARQGGHKVAELLLGSVLRDRAIVDFRERDWAGRSHRGGGGHGSDEKQTALR